MMGVVGSTIHWKSLHGAQEVGESREHIEKDIMICNRIGHCQGEAKGYINLGELHYRVQKCEDAIRCYEKALKLAQSMEDEAALVDQISQNIETVKEARKVMDELKTEAQNLKKLMRNMPMARGTDSERKCLLQQNASLDCLIDKSSMIFAWLKVCLLIPLLSFLALNMITFHLLLSADMILMRVYK